MNRRLFFLLSFVTALQCLAIAFVWWPNDAGPTILRPVISFPAQMIDKISIITAAGGEQKPLILSLAEERQWNIDSALGYPARQDRVDELLGRLAGLKVRTPVSTDKAQHASMGVSSDRFNRKIQLWSGSESAIFYVGQGKGNSVNIRIDGTDEVFVAHGTTAWRLSGDPNDYFERVFFELPGGAIQRLSVDSPLGSYQLIVDKGRLTYPDLNPGERLNQEGLSDAVHKITRLIMRSLAGKDNPSDFGMDNATKLTFHLEYPDGTTETRTLSIGEVSPRFAYVKTDTGPFTVVVSAANVLTFVDSKISDFILSTSELPPVQAYPPGRP